MERTPLGQLGSPVHREAVHLHHLLQRPGTLLLDDLGHVLSGLHVDREIRVVVLVTDHHHVRGAPSDTLVEPATEFFDTSAHRNPFRSVRPARERRRRIGGFSRTALLGPFQRCDAADHVRHFGRLCCCIDGYIFTDDQRAVLAFSSDTPRELLPPGLGDRSAFICFIFFVLDAH
ncbi:hypothetical protein [Micromonospora echinospora]|uniref:hypothetical protein n=1 Tax=Micromonospora echinospora TaxID=1877 RepID=UPI00366AB93F